MEITLDEYRKQLISHDWYSDYSDDGRVVRAGWEGYKRLSDLKELSLEHTLSFDQYSLYAQRGLRHPSTWAEKFPKPTWAGEDTELAVYNFTILPEVVELYLKMERLVKDILQGSIDWKPKNGHQIAYMPLDTPAQKEATNRGLVVKSHPVALSPSMELAVQGVRDDLLRLSILIKVWKIDVSWLQYNISGKDPLFYRTHRLLPVSPCGTFYIIRDTGSFIGKIPGDFML